MKNIIVLLRVKDWLKNIVIFFPILFSSQLFYISHYSSLFIGFISFCILSSFIFKYSLQKQQSVRNTIVFLWTSPRKVSNVIAVWKKSCQLWRKSKAFSFPSKTNFIVKITKAMFTFAKIRTQEYEGWCQNEFGMC